MSAVEVNEVKVVSRAEGRDWWIDFRRTQHPSRFTVVRATLVGDVVRVACDGAEDARMLAAMLVDYVGLPKTAVKVVARPDDEGDGRG